MSPCRAIESGQRPPPLRLSWKGSNAASSAFSPLCWSQLGCRCYSVTHLSRLLLCECFQVARAIAVSQGSALCLACIWGLGCPGEGVESGVREHVGEFTIPPGVSGQMPPSQWCVSSQVLVTVGMAAQGVGPGEPVPRMAQTLCVPALVDGKSALCWGPCFITPAACRSRVWHICWGPLGRRALNDSRGGTQQQQHEVWLGGTTLAEELWEGRRTPGPSPSAATDSLTSGSAAGGVPQG